MEIFLISVGLIAIAFSGTDSSAITAATEEYSVSALKTVEIDGV